MPSDIENVLEAYGNNLVGAHIDNSSGSGGHTIQDASGNDMPQEPNLQFAGYLKTTDDSSDNKTVVSDAPTEVTYDDYMAMTPAQKQGTKWLITNAPGHLATNQAIFTLKDQELTFTGTTATVSDQRINTSTYPLIYWDDSSIEAAAEAHITSIVSNGQITFTAETAPASTLTCDIVFISNAYSGGGSGGGGHVIMDNTGEELPQESSLQFADAEVTDDSTNSKTVVKVVRQMTQAEFDELSQSEKAGVIKVTDANAPQMLASQIKASDGNNLDTLVVPYVVDFDVWNAYDEEERSALKAAHPKIHVTNVPEADGTVDVEMFTKLWENSSPTASFAPQNITLSSDDYDLLLTLSIFNTSHTDRAFASEITPKGKNIVISNAYTRSGSAAYTTTVYREYTYVNDTTYSVGNGTIQNSNGASSNSNESLIPLAIYGIKSTVSLKISAIASDVSTSASKCMMSDGETSVEDAVTYKDVYSTTEHIVGKWIDGSPIYEKTVEFGALPNNSYKNVAHGITNYRMFIDVKGFAYDGNGVYANLPYAEKTSDAIISLVAYSSYIQIQTGNDRSGYNAYITLRYTKTS